MGLVFFLLIIFQIKHFVADYPLQTPYMLQKFKGGTDWILPLTAHAGVHALGTFYISLLITARIGLSLSLGLFDFTVHFVMDRVKASPNMLGRFKSLTASEFPKASEEQKLHNKYFWWALGLDQAVHHVTHYGIIACICYVVGVT